MRFIACLSNAEVRDIPSPKIEGLDAVGAKYASRLGGDKGGIKRLRASDQRKVSDATLREASRDSASARRIRWIEIDETAG